MIREALGSAYRKTIGAVKDAVLGFVSSITRGGGLIQALYVILLVALMAGFVDAVVFGAGAAFVAVDVAPVLNGYPGGPFK